VDKLFDRQPKVTRADFITLARRSPTHRLAGQRPAAVPDTEGIRRRRPAASDTILFSSGGLYGATHLPMALLTAAAGGLKLRHLPTNGGGPAHHRHSRNNVRATTQTVSASLTHVKSGKLRPLALFGGTRSKRCCRTCRR